LLLELDIKNYALIDHLHINFADGFSVITGETGSGKSILLGALSLILGERADAKSIRDKGQKCIIEGVFHISSNELTPFFMDNDLDYEQNTIIRREISPQGKSRAFINDTPVSLSILKSLSEQLIDIHSQHATLLLTDKNFIFNLIDNQIKNQDLLETYHQDFLVYQLKSAELKELHLKEQQSVADKNYNEFLLTEFENVDLNTALADDIETEFNLLSNAEDLKKILFQCQEYFNGPNGIITTLQNVSNEIGKIQQVGKPFKELAERINSTLIEIQDIESELVRQDERIEVDNQKLNQIENVLSKINALLKKHNVITIEELCKVKDQIETKLQSIGSISEEITKTETEIKQLKTVLISKAKEISTLRKSIIPKLEGNAKNLLSQMKMASAEIQFKLSHCEELNKHGIDNIELLAKTNLGGNFEVLKKIASGGESSRIMLAIKSLQTQHKSLPTIIFDEIDTGVSGEVATNMGSIMQKLGKTMQVISITHLPQIASKGKSHYKVFKTEANKTTLTQIDLLSDKDRITEIAQMLSSNKVTQASIENAKELLRN